MIGLDTNVLIRYLVQDDPEQSKRVSRCIEKWIKEEEVLWICQLTLCETFWVLERCYKLAKEELISILSSLLQTKQIQIEQEDVVWEALRDYGKSTRVNFPDCLIGRKNAHHECTQTYTFDKDVAKYLTSTFALMP